MKEFIFKSPTIIQFGLHSSMELPKICHDKQLSHICFVIGKHTLDSTNFQNILYLFQKNNISYNIFSGVSTEPTVSIVDSATNILKASNAEGIIAIGGGSVLDTAKAMAVLATNPGSAKDYLFGGKSVIQHPSLPLFCIPTTAGSGSEVTASSVILHEEKQVKLSITHNFLFPDMAIIDPIFHLSMPHQITIGTGMDALTHAIEAYTSTTASPLSDMYALQAISMLGSNIKIVAQQPDNLEAREKMALGSTLAALAFVNGGLGAVHGIAQALGGIAHVPHGIGNAILLPHVMKINLTGNPEKFANIATALGLSTSNCTIEEAALLAANYIQELSKEIGIPDSMRGYNITKEMHKTILEETMNYRLLKCNPVPITEQIVENILKEVLQ